MIIQKKILEAYEEVCEQYLQDQILLVADNYESHHAELIQRRANEFGIEFVFIQIYSPMLNAIKAQ